MAPSLLTHQHPQLVVIKQTYLTYFLICIQKFPSLFYVPCITESQVTFNQQLVTCLSPVGRLQRQAKIHFQIILQSYLDALLSSPKLQSRRYAHFKQPSPSANQIPLQKTTNTTENVNQPGPSITKVNKINCKQMP